MHCWSRFTLDLHPQPSATPARLQKLGRCQTESREPTCVAATTSSAHSLRRLMSRVAIAYMSCGTLLRSIRLASDFS